MILTRCRFEGLRGFDELDLTDLNQLTTLTGPNGAGKSTVLRVLNLAFLILNKKTVSDKLPEHDPWDRFTVANLQFARSNPAPLNHVFAEYLGQDFNEIFIQISCDETSFVISEIRCQQHCLSFVIPQVKNSDIQSQKATVNSIVTQQADAQRRLSTVQVNTPLSQQIRAEQVQLSTNLEQQQDELSRLHKLTFQRTGSDAPVEANRNDVDSFLNLISFPIVTYVDARRLHEEAIPKLISELMTQKKGRRSSMDQFAQATAQLGHLLQAEVDLSDIDGKEEMHINGVPYQRASAGTQITLSFFGLTQLGEPGCIILWDEPENGLHPTRRVRLLDLMFEDGRQFILATHAAEFAPVFSTKGKVFRCISEYDDAATIVKLSVKHIADRRDAFLALEALGVHPARTLFTANVVIWVEGPTELLFYRHWLTPLLRDRGFFEGFHYTFMQYGGALISYLSIADEAQFESTFDLLSLCRHPVVIVDSDFRVDPGNTPPPELLKKGAARLFREIEKLREHRPNAAMFDWTAGREVENYLPESAIWHAVASLWSGYTDYAEKLKSKRLVIGQYDSYHESLNEHFKELEVVDIDPKDNTKKHAKGRSIWGQPNKVEMMRSALTTEGFTIENLCWNGAARLRNIENFVVALCQS